MVRITKRTGISGMRTDLSSLRSKIRIRTGDTLLSADPLRLAALVIVAVEVQAVAMWAEGSTQVVEAALETGEGIVIAGGTAQGDGTQGFEVLVNEGEDLVEAFPGISEDFANLEMGKTAQKILKTRNSEQVIVAIGRGERAGEGPKGEQAIIEHIEGLGFVAEVMFATR